MNKIVKIFLALVLTVSMMLEMVPVNIINADDEIPTVETVDLSKPVLENEDEKEKKERPETVETVTDEAPSVETVEKEEPADEPSAEVLLNAEAFSKEYVLDDLKVTVAYEAGTVLEGTEVVVSEAKAEAVEAIKAESEEELIVKGADISFVYNNEEIEPKDYSSKKVTVTLEYAGKYDLTGVEFETLHVKETLDEAGTVVYGVQTVEAVMTPVTETVEVPYEYTWTETVTRTVEVPVYETREITEEHTELVTKTREVEKTRLVKVQVDFVWWDPSTWLGYKYVWETYTVTETYEEEVTVTEVVGYEEVQVGTRQEEVTEEVEHTETKYEEKEIVVGQTAVFEADDFSTYTLTWADGSATIHWGTVEEGQFVELTTPTTIDSTASNVDINVIIDASKYYFVGAEYKLTENAEEYENLKSTVLHKVDGVWQISLEDSGTVAIASGSHIYVHYAPYSEENPYNPPAAPSGDVLSPDTEKTVTDNEDGTYTVRLDIEGKSDHTTTQVGANVIIVMDITQSMTNDMPDDTGTRMDAAKTALTALINTLDPDTNLINFAAVNFGNNAQPYSVTFDNNATWTTNKTSMQSYVDGLPADDYGTCWQAGLRGGYNLANAARSDANLKNNQTYVIFVTDGNPNCYARNNDGSGRWYGSTGPGYSANAYTAATYWANLLPGISQFYGVFCGDDSGADHLEDLIKGAYGNDASRYEGKFINGSSTSTIESAFANIAQTIVTNLGAGGVTVDDGIPTLSNVSANVSGEVDDGGFKYYIKPLNGEETVWEDAPAATYSQTNGVTWDLGEAGELQNGWIYSLEFQVWPSQAAYDLIADLNNGIKDYDNLSEEEQAAVQGSKEDGYTLKTNTHLYTTFTDLDGNVYREVNATNAEDMPLPTETISVEKLWNNWLDNSHGSSDIDGLQMVLSRDGEDYLEFDVSAETNWKKEEIYISCGQIVDGVIKENGHDYYVTEKPKDEENDKTEYWEVNSPYYHPMVVDGVMTVFVRDDEATNPAFTLNGHKYVESDEGTNLVAINERVSWLNLIKKLEAVQGETLPEGAEDILFKYQVKITEPEEDATETKAIFFSVRGGGVNYRDDIVTDATKTVEGGNTYYYVENGQSFYLYVKADWSTRFLNLASGTEYSITEVKEGMEPGFAFKSAKAVETLYIGVNGVRTIAQNYPKTSTFDDVTVTGTINQTNTDYTVTYTNEYQGVFYVYHSSDNTVERIPMAVNGVAYSSSNPFNIYAKTAAGTLYGGYYSDYKGKSSSYDPAALTYDANNKATDTGGQAYIYENISITDSNKKFWTWTESKAYTTNGEAMTPQRDLTYFLKEVPNAYMLPYTHYTYYRNENKDLTGLLTITAVDDLNYEAAGFFVETATYSARITTSLKIKAANGTVTTTLTAAKIYKSKGMEDGYLGWADLTSYIQSTDSIKIKQFWTTPDGIEVLGTTKREVKFGDKTARPGTGITREDSPVND